VKVPKVTLDIGSRAKPVGTHSQQLGREPDPAIDVEMHGFSLRKISAERQTEGENSDFDPVRAAQRV
jgi:hypothetical protein